MTTKLISEGTAVSVLGGYACCVLTKPQELRNSVFDEVMIARLQYTGLPAGVKIKITVEEIIET